MKSAIIGSGISGLGIAYLLNEAGHDITIFEKNDYIGGHSRTVNIKTEGKDIGVDTGFIVFNYKNYPHLSKLFEHIGVDIAESNMSFGVSISDNWLEYGTQELSNIIAQKRNLLRPKFWKMLKDIMYFNKNAKKYIESEKSLGEALDEMKMGEWFRKYYLLAMGGAIWSTPSNGMNDFPAKTFIRFFDNHGLLSVNDQPQWHTVIGGSKKYVAKITEKFIKKIKLNCGAESIKREGGKVTLTDSNGKVHKFDQVVFACHSNQALEILKDASIEEKSIIGAFDYQPNKMILHKDDSFMPKNKNCWSSWIYLSDDKEDESNNVSLTYWMNNLQPLDTQEPILVTLNPSKRPAEDKIFDEYIFEHPVFNKKAIDCQSRISEIQGVNNTWFCGAYLRYGFHEDGLLSAVNVAKKMGLEIPWE